MRQLNHSDEVDPTRKFVRLPPPTIKRKSMTTLPDYFPRPDLRRNHYKDKHIEIVCNAELVHGMTWRPMFKFTIVVGKRQFSESAVLHNELFATPDEAETRAHIACIDKMKVLFTWDKSLSAIKDELIPFADKCRRLKIDLKDSKIWQG